jgi:hypothetical protein
MIRKGTLVSFHSTVKSFQKDYQDRNPGVIVAHNKGSASSAKHSWDRGSAYILWANGEMTREHTSYLKVLSDD